MHVQSSPFFIGNGTKQGGILSPYLFTRYIRELLSVVSQCSTVVRNVVRATQQVNGKWPFSGCQNSVTPEPID